ncbi:hypothetical protein HAX54_037170 [Datura stramonium]|uniref:Uncharacterized protein n=1 Tax=Datura stramonium TaxID=4076 RepID=A0ABS8VHY6_DATST|nr:hypothetical protein [Datura stramonium]
MELIEARALKSSFLSDMTMKSSQQVFLDDIWCVTGINNGASDDFSVDDLLDFSDKDFKDGSLQELHEDDEKDTLSGSSQNRNSEGDSTSFPVWKALAPSPANSLFRLDEMENQWLSIICGRYLVGILFVVASPAVSK